MEDNYFDVKGSKDGNMPFKKRPFGMDDITPKNNLMDNIEIFTKPTLPKVIK